MSDINLNSKQRNVLRIINDYPEAANNEAMLLERYWIEIDRWDETKSLYWNLSKVTRPETISRRRRELYNLGLISYSDKTEKERTEAFNNEKERAAPQAVSWLKD